MARVRSKRLVIDASVAQAAGPQHSVHPRGKSCRDFLLAVLKVCHRAAFSAALKTEWKQHHSKFALEWQTSMFARKKIENLDVEEDPQLRERVCNAAENDKQEAALFKDCHLIEAALEPDKITSFLSMKRLGGRFGRRPSPLLICEISAGSTRSCFKEKALEWLERGAPNGAARGFALLSRK